MKTADLYVYAFVVFLALLVLAALKRRSRAPIAKSYEFTARPVLSQPEQVLFYRLRDAAPNCVVLAQVNMRQVLRVRTGGKAALNAITQKAVDFVVCRPDFSVVCVVELDDKSHSKARDMTRDTYMTSASIETLRFDVGAMPSVSDLAALLRKFKV